MAVPLCVVESAQMGREGGKKVEDLRKTQQIHSTSPNLAFTQISGKHVIRPVSRIKLYITAADNRVTGSCMNTRITS
jgi:hypothetical protein